METEQRSQPDQSELFKTLIVRLKEFYTKYKRLTDCPDGTEALVDITTSAVLSSPNITTEIINTEVMKIFNSASLVPNDDVSFYNAFGHHKLCDLKNLIDSAVKPDDSCGAISNNLGVILLGENNVTFPRDNSADRQKFTELSQDKVKPFLEKINGLKNEHVMRVDIERLNPDNNQWQSSHSYMVLIDKNQKTYVLQAYVLNYTLQEWLVDPNYTSLQSQTLTRHIEQLSNLHCTDSEDNIKKNEQLQSLRGQIYTSLFRKKDDVVPSKDCPMKVHCLIQELKPNEALNRLNILQENIEKNNATLLKTNNIEDTLTKEILNKSGFDKNADAIIEINSRYDILAKEASSLEGMRKFFGY